jgi:hypothetical protein
MKIEGSGSASGSISQRGVDPRIRIRIHTKMSWIRNTELEFKKILWGLGTE